jgi:hypothetical protein
VHSSSCLFSLGALGRVKKQQATRETSVACCTNYGRSGPAKGRAVYLNGADKQPLSRPLVTHWKNPRFLTEKSVRYISIHNYTF